MCRKLLSVRFVYLANILVASDTHLIVVSLIVEAKSAGHECRFALFAWLTAS